MGTARSLGLRAQMEGWNADITRDQHAESGMILQESLFKKSLHTTKNT